MTELRIPRRVIIFDDLDMQTFFEYARDCYLEALRILAESREPKGMVSLDDLRGMAHRMAAVIADEFQGDAGFEAEIFNMLHLLFAPFEEAVRDTEKYGPAPAREGAN